MAPEVRPWRVRALVVRPVPKPNGEHDVKRWTSGPGRQAEARAPTIRKERQLLELLPARIFLPFHAGRKGGREGVTGARRVRRISRRGAQARSTASRRSGPCVRVSHACAQTSLHGGIRSCVCGRVAGKLEKAGAAKNMGARIRRTAAVVAKCGPECVCAARNRGAYAIAAGAFRFSCSSCLRFLGPLSLLNPRPRNASSRPGIPMKIGQYRPQPGNRNACCV